MHISTTPDDTDAYFQTQPALPCPDVKGYNLLHINAIYDLCNRFYVGTRVYPGRHQNEHKALIDMVDCSHIQDNVIKSYNDFAHIEKNGWNYIIRVKDLGSNGILSGLSLPSSGAFDVLIQRTLTRKRTKEVKAHPETYKVLPNNSILDFLDFHTNKCYPTLVFSGCSF